MNYNYKGMWLIVINEAGLIQSTKYAFQKESFSNSVNFTIL